MTVSIVGWDEQLDWVLGSDPITMTWTVPGAVQAGCLMVVFGGGGRAFQSSNVPAGWTGLAAVAPGVFRGIWKVSDGTEGSVSVTFAASFGTLYAAVSAVLVAFTKRSYTETPDTSWEVVPFTNYPNPATGPQIQFDAVNDASAAEDAIYLAWANYTSGTSDITYGYDACADLSFNWDADITQIETDCMYETHARGSSNPALQSASVKWAVGWTPIVAGVNPATTTTFTDTFPSGGNRFIARSLEAGLSAALAPYWGILVGP